MGDRFTFIKMIQNKYVFTPLYVCMNEYLSNLCVIQVKAFERLREYNITDNTMYSVTSKSCHYAEWPLSECYIIVLLCH